MANEYKDTTHMKATQHGDDDGDDDNNDDQYENNANSHNTDTDTSNVAHTSAGNMANTYKQQKKNSQGNIAHIKTTWLI